MQEETLAKQVTSETIVENPQAQKPLDRRLVWLMAVASALSAANLYYVQPILADMGRSFHASSASIGFVATLTQLGYAVGLLLIVPLGDRYNRRNLIAGMLLIVVLALMLVAVSPSPGFLMVASLLVGITTVAPQLIIPLAASIAAPYERGRVVGMVMSGLLIGILLARTVSGVVAAHLGWRAVYWIAAGLMLLLAVLMRLTLPLDRSRSTMSYKELLRSLVPLLREEPVLRETSLFGALSFGAFSVFWVTLGFFLETPPYHYGSAVVGTFGLVGVVGATAATFAGRLADRIDARRVIGVTMLITLSSFVLMGLTGQWLWGLIAGVILLDLGVQGTQVSNQARIYSLNPAARNRLNTIYMVTYFIGGSLGSYLGVLGWSIARWWGVCGAALLMMLVALCLYVFNSRK